MKVGIVGSRRRTDKKAVEKLVESLPDYTTIVSGGCKGVDTWAVEAGRGRGLRIMEYLPYKPPEDSPKWEYTKAYHTRNKKIAQASDIIYAFVAEDRTGGTENTIKYAQELGTPVEIK